MAYLMSPQFNTKLEKRQQRLRSIKVERCCCLSVTINDAFKIGEDCIAANCMHQTIVNWDENEISRRLNEGFVNDLSIGKTLWVAFELMEQTKLQCVNCNQFDSLRYFPIDLFTFKRQFMLRTNWRETQIPACFKTNPFPTCVHMHVYLSEARKPFRSLHAIDYCLRAAEELVVGYLGIS